MISLEKTYVTRAGRPVRLLMVEGGGLKPIVGAIYYKDNELSGNKPAQWVARHWYEGGWFYSASGVYRHNNDLVKIPLEQANPEPPTEEGDEA